MGQAEKAALADVIDSGYINDGQVTRQFEAEIAKIAGTAYCVAVTSGTTAITLALMGMRVGPGDEVLVPDLTFIATANAVRLTGASVRLVDVEPKNFTIDVERVAAAIGPRTRAIVPVDVNGRGCDYAALEMLCRDHGLVMVTDSCEALGSRHMGKPLGSFGAAGCFSFSPNKTITTGQGGAITTDDAALVDRLRELKDQGRRVQGTGGDDLHPVLGYNFKLTNIQAAIGLAQLEHFQKRIKKAKRQNGWYFDRLHAAKGIDASRLKDGKDGTALQWSDILCDDRSALVRAFEADGIGNRPFWLPLHRQEPYKADDADFPITIEISAKGLWLPSHFDLTEEQTDRVVSVISEHHVQ